MQTSQGPDRLAPALTEVQAELSRIKPGCSYRVWMQASFLKNPVINQRCVLSARAADMSKLKIVLYVAINRAGEQVVGKLLTPHSPHPK